METKAESRILGVGKQEGTTRKLRTNFRESAENVRGVLFVHVPRYTSPPHICTYPICTHVAYMDPSVRNAMKWMRMAVSAIFRDDGRAGTEAGQAPESGVWC